MPSPSEQLTEAHRLAQARLGARTVSDLLTAWSLIDPKNLTQTQAAWIRVAARLVTARHLESSRLAADYLRSHRLLNLGEAAPAVFAEVDVRAVWTSLEVTGPVSLKRAMAAGRTLAEAAETAQVNTARAGMRHALAGGRDTITATVAADPDAAGYQRVTSGSACDFCSMLAGRGAVYSDSTVNFAAHDGCSCSSQPVYNESALRRVADWTGRRDIPEAQRAGDNARAREFIAAQRASATG